MRYLLLSTLFATVLFLLLGNFHHDLTTPFSWSVASEKKQTEVVAAAARSDILDQIARLERYDDPDYGFSVAIPAGWTRIVADDSTTSADDDILASLEPGYAVGFESPRSGLKDQFADYILIEVLPGDDIGLFDVTEEQRYFIHSGAEVIAYDRIEVDATTDNISEVDLVIFQRGVRAFGYTLGFYAIGEPGNEQTLFDAFQILLRTYTQTADPFVII